MRLLTAIAALVLAAGSAGAETPEPVATTAHAIRWHGGMLRYTAEASRLVQRDSASGEPRAAIFYTAYRVAAPRTPRPLTFVWNGGPGSNSLLLHTRAFGPRRIARDAFEDNPATLLDASDLVFVDPVGTGFSRAAKADYETDYYRTLGDFASIAAFVRQWIASHHAEGAPLFLAGESFGTWRAAAVAELLERGGQHVAGIVLISGGCPVGPIQPPEVRTALRVPGWTAAALVHHKLEPDAGSNRDAMIAASARWAAERYAPALARVGELSDAERDTIARELAHWVGLPADSISRATLRVGPRKYLSSLLGDRLAVLNPFDMRISTFELPLPRVAISRYLRDELKYDSPLSYRLLEPERDSSATLEGLTLNERWKYDSAPITREAMAAAQAGEGPPGAQPWVTRALALNPRMRVLVAAGRFDSFNSCWANEDLAQRLPPEIAGNIAFRCYDGGHMMYLDPGPGEQLSRDVREFILATR
jgi:carboxypeptidase C (cathepsin A)